MTTDEWLRLVTLALGIAATVASGWRSRAKELESKEAKALEDSAAAHLGLQIAQERAERAEQREQAAVERAERAEAEKMKAIAQHEADGAIARTQLDASHERASKAEERATTVARELADLRLDGGAGGGAQGRTGQTGRQKKDTR